ncbi:MAG: type II secretion system F family protein, partial [bacterium]
KDKEKARFFLMLYTAIKSGLPLYRALLIVKDSLDVFFRDLILNLAEDLRRGVSLYNSLNKRKDLFEPLVLRLVYVGENTGRLENIFFYIYRYYENKSKLKNKLISSAIYPIFIMVITILISYFVMTAVFPSILNLYAEMDLRLPFLTKIVSYFTKLFSLKNLIIIIIIFVIVVIFLNFYVKKDVFYEKLISSLLSIKFVNEFYKKYFNSMFLYSLSLCIKSGLSMSDSIKFSLLVFPDFITRKYLGDIYKRILEGEALSDILANNKQVPKIVTYFIRTYEETGKVEVLDSLCDFMNFEIEITLESLLSLTEPLLITFVAFFTVILALSILLPIISLGLNFGM